MGVVQLAKATLVIPRSDLQEALREVSSLGLFHPIQQQPPYDPNLAELSLRAYKLYVELNDAAQGLGVKGQPSLMEAILKGYTTEKVKLKAKDWGDFIQRTEAEAKPLIEEASRLLEERRSLQRTVSEKGALKAALSLISGFSFNLESLARSKRFKLVFAVAPTKDVKEVKRSLPELLVLDAPLTKSESAFLMAGSVSDHDRIEKVLRSFEVKPFSIHRGLPQNPKEAYLVVESELLELKERLALSGGLLAEAKQRIGRKLLALRESASAAHIVLEKLKQTGGLRKFATVQGYIPLDKAEELKARCRDRWLSLTEPVGHPAKEPQEAAPSLLTNRGMAKDFEKITLTQGPPRYGEVDPTPLITFFFPFFFGFMFADFGHGLALLAVGLVMRKRGMPSHKSWGTILMVAGFSAMIAGIMIGEAFGEELKHLIPFIGSLGYSPLLELIERARGQFNVESVTTILKITFLVGMAHLMIGYVLDLIKSLREKGYVEAFISKLPTITFYVSFIIVGLSIVSAGTSFTALMTSPSPIPIISMLVNIPISSAMVVALPFMISSIFVLVAGRPFAIVMGKAHREPLGWALIMGLIEVLERVVSYLANTVSYTRLAVLLLVHSALLLTLSAAAALPPLAAIPLLVLGNAGIIALEGLIVYIQDLRLHIYEWFTKFYEGTGVPFTKVVPETDYIEIKLE